jgi:hypothetical protein
MHQFPSLPPPSLKQLLLLATHGETAQRLREFQQPIDENFFGIAHLAGVAQEYGRQHGWTLQLGLHRDGGDSFIQRHGDANANTLWIHHEGAHYTGMKQMAAGNSAPKPSPSLNGIAQDPAPELFDYRPFRSFIMGENLYKPTDDYDYLQTSDWYEGTTVQQQDNAFEGLSKDQRRKVDGFCPRVPFDVLYIQGPAGTSKTTIERKLIELQMMAGRKVLAVASSNEAITNLFVRMTATIDEEKFLLLRVWSENNEMKVLKACTDDNIEEIISRFSVHLRTD